jgi:hypothetical protein
LAVSVLGDGRGGGVNGDSRGGIKAGELGALIGVSMMEAGRRGTINCSEVRWRRASGRPVGSCGSDVRRNIVDGLRKLKEEAPFGKYYKAAHAEWAEWAERARGGLRAKRPGLLGAGPDGPESEGK